MIRNTDVKPRRRTYTSELRTEQADATRTRILEALVREMGKGVGALSIPAVAREAGVSIPTIYRHFGSKQGLIDALGQYVSGRAGLLPTPAPSDMAQFAGTARRLFANLASMDATLRAAMASDLGWEARRASMPTRLRTIRETVDALAPGATDADRERLTKLALILMATPTFHAYHDYLGLSADDAADLVTWTVATLIAGLSHGDDGTEPG